MAISRPFLGSAYLLALFFLAGRALANEPGTQPPAATSSATPKLSAQDVHAAAKPYVFRLSTTLKSAGSRALHGTAFVIESSGYLVTNFHVVQKYLFSEGEMKLELEVGSEKIAAEVVAVDAVNDLSLIKVARAFPSALPLAAPHSAAEGEVIYSFGFPANEQLTFAQGNFGGEKLTGFSSAGLATIPLNQGMSGGPMLNAHGEVIGVNRAMVVAAQNLSFFSPHAALYELVQKRFSRSPASGERNWRSEVTRSILDQEKRVGLGAIAGSKRERLGALSFSLPLPNQTCGQTKSKESEGESANLEYFTCRTGGLTPLKGDTQALAVTTIALHGSGTRWLSANMPLAKVLKRRYSEEVKDIQLPKSKRIGLASASNADRELCQLRKVRNANIVELTMSYCSVANEFFPGLFSTFTHIEISSGKGPGIAIAQVYQGLSAATTAEILQKFLDSITLEEKS